LVAISRIIIGIYAVFGAVIPIFTTYTALRKKKFFKKNDIYCRTESAITQIVVLNEQDQR